MYLVPDVEGDQQCSDGFDDASVLQLPAVDGANTGNLHRKIGSDLSSAIVVATDDDVAIHIVIAIQQRVGEAVKRGSNSYILAHNVRRLFRS